ncbi:MAG: helix-turn-helix transcriptional regulator, partial [Maribacter sp.]|nr:helix-turn-helix transcriptional regulator [Maribacter sp.]
MENYFAKNLKYLRKERNISQTALAIALKISRSKVASYESRGVEPQLQLLISIAQFFDISLEDLIGKDIQTKVNLEGKKAIQPFTSELPSQTTEKPDGINLNTLQTNNLDNFLKESATIVKMLEGFKVFYKIKAESKSLEELTPEVRKAHHDIQNM